MTEQPPDNGRIFFKGKLVSKEPGFAEALMSRLTNLQLSNGDEWIRPLQVQRVEFDFADPLWVVKVSTNQGDTGYVRCSDMFDYLNDETVDITEVQ